MRRQVQPATARTNKQHSCSECSESGNGHTHLGEVLHVPVESYAQLPLRRRQQLELCRAVRAVCRRRGAAPARLMQTNQTSQISQTNVRDRVTWGRSHRHCSGLSVSLWQVSNLTFGRQAPLSRSQVRIVSHATWDRGCEKNKIPIPGVTSTRRTE